MKSLEKLMLLIAVAVTTLTLSAAAQNSVPRTEAPPPTLSHGVYVPSQSTAKFTQVDSDRYRRCDTYRGRPVVWRGYAYAPRPRYAAVRGWHDSRGF